MIRETRNALTTEILAAVTRTANPSEVRARDTGVDTDTEERVDVVLDNTPRGVDRYNVTVRLSDNGVGRIKQVKPGDIEDFKVRYRTPNTASFRASDPEESVEPGCNDVVLASVVVEGVKTGSSAVEIEVNELRDVYGEPIEPRIENGCLTVGGGEPRRASWATAVAGGFAAAVLVTWRWFL